MGNLAHAGRRAPDAGFLLFSGIEALLDLGPVHHVPPRGNILRPPVLILQIVSVLPHVQAHNGKLALHNRAVLVSGRVDIELARTILHQPGPAGAETRGGGVVELLLELLKPAKRAVDGLRDITRRIAAALWGKDLPKHRMI